MENIFLLIDFGSTFTKVAAVDIEKEELLGKAQSPTTVADNMLIGLQNSLTKLIINNRPITADMIAKSRKLACSSAAGGLNLIAIGLVPSLTLEAARRAALGAGAKVVASYSYELTVDDIAKIEHTDCDIILLSGGTDGGNKEAILHNANLLASTKLNMPFVIAGNRIVSHEIKDILEKGGKYAEITENVLPDIDTLNVAPARSCIRDIFMKRITHAKGLDKAQEFIGDILMPTPMATLKAAQLLADGYAKESGIGEIMVVEIGGATTNIHSVANGYRKGSQNVMKGLMEPYAKRTVEGDLGIRYNAATIVEILSPEKVYENIPDKNGIDVSNIRTMASALKKIVSFIPKTELDFQFDIGLARSAVEIAVERHAGYIKEVFMPPETVNLQYGKDLTELKTVIGTGGIFAYNPKPRQILEYALYNLSNPYSLKPKSPDFFIDQQYILYGTGLLSEVEPQKALKIARKYLKKLEN